VTAQKVAQRALLDAILGTLTSGADAGDGDVQNHWQTHHGNENPMSYTEKDVNLAPMGQSPRFQRLRNRAIRWTLPGTKISWEETMNASIPRRHILATGSPPPLCQVRPGTVETDPHRRANRHGRRLFANTGPGSVAGTKLAIEDFAKLHPDVKVELVSADYS